MIETGLIYVHACQPKTRFVGCGALVEGGFVATCRHVWRMATQEAHANDGAQLPGVEIEFPYSRRNGVPIRSMARLADACEGIDDLIPDLVLLLPEDIPSGVMTLQLAALDRFEVGHGYAIAGLAGRNEQRPTSVSDVRVAGSIADYRDSNGRRQFTGQSSTAYWPERGSSGSPVFCASGQQLAGILSLSELGANAGESPLHEAFVVPATTIRRYVSRLLARPVMVEAKIDPADLQPILDQIGAQDVAIAEIPGRLRQFVEAALVYSAEPVAHSNEGADIDAVIGASRAKMQRFDTEGARDVLQAKITEEMLARVQRLLPLLKERLEVERLTLDHEAAKASLNEITGLTPDDVWAWINLGDLWRTTGSLAQAERAYRNAQAAAQRIGDDRDLSVSHNKIGDVLLAQGDRDGALTAYQASLAIREPMARRDPDNSGWQRDLSVSHNNIGKVLLAQGDCIGALTAFQASLAIRESMARRNPDNTRRQRDLSVSHNNIGNVLLAQGDRVGALAAYRACLAIREPLAHRDPGNAQCQRDLSVSHDKIGDVLLEQGNRDGALAAYQASLAIAEALACRDPGNTGWQRDLSISHDKIGNMLLAQGDHDGALAAYRSDLAIAEALALRDPGNTEWQRDLSVSHNNIGKVLLAQGDRDSALAAYQADLAIAEALARRDPGNTGWQRDLSVTHDNIGDVLLAQGKRDGALVAYQASLEIRELLALRNPGNTEWQRDLSVSRDNVRRCAAGAR